MRKRTALKMLSFVSIIVLVAGCDSNDEDGEEGTGTESVETEQSPGEGDENSTTTPEAPVDDGTTQAETQTLCDLATLRVNACFELLCGPNPEHETCAMRADYMSMVEVEYCEEFYMNMAASALDVPCSELLSAPEMPDDPTTRIPVAEQPQHEPEVRPSMFADDPPQEAEVSIRRLYDASISYFDRELVNAMGQVLPPQFPTSTGLTPAEVPCGTTYQSNNDDWGRDSGYTWMSLNFAMSDPQYYSYQYDSSGTEVGATFTATAFGDLDCDGVLSTFQRTGRVLVGFEIDAGEGLVIVNPDE